MTRRLFAVMTCLLLIFAAGCDFFAVPSSSPASSAPSPTIEVITTGTSSTGTTEATAGATTPEATTEAPTPSPTEEPTAKPTPTPNPTEGMIFPNSDTKLIPWKSLIVLSSDKLGYARNEIYARAGYKFTSKKYADYYSAFDWYKEDSSFSESDFSDVQRANIHLIQAAEKAIKGQLYEFSSGMKLDYDQDGHLETLTISYPDDNHATVSMKDGSTTTLWKISGEAIIKKAYLGDIDFKDSKLDLFIGEAGPSDDFSVYVAGLKHNAFLQRGKIPGAINSGSSKSPFRPDGKGYITTLRRMDIIATDFFIVKYKLNSSGKLVFYPYASYDFISFSSSKYTATTKVPIPLKKTASSTSAVLLTVPAGTVVQFVSTDAKKWIKVKAPGGTGWLEMASTSVLTNPNIPASDAFNGLVIAD